MILIFGFSFNFFSVLTPVEAQHLNAVIWHLFLHVDLILISDDLVDLINKYQIASAVVLVDGAAGGAAVPAAGEAGGAVGLAEPAAGDAGGAVEDTENNGHREQNGHDEGGASGDISPRPHDE